MSRALLVTCGLALMALARADGVDSLIYALRDTSPWVKQEVIAELSRTGDARAASALLALLRAEQPAFTKVTRVVRVAPVPESLAASRVNPGLRKREASRSTRPGQSQPPRVQPEFQPSPPGVQLQPPAYVQSLDLVNTIPRALAEIGAPAVPVLISALKDSNESVRSAAARALGQIRDSTAVPALIAVLGDSGWWTAPDAEGALRNIGEPAVPALISASHSPDTLVRLRAMRALSSVKDPRVTDVLIAASKDPLPGVREMAIEGLTNWAHRDKAAGVFETALDDPDAGVRAAALDGLGEIGSERALVLFRRMLNDTLLQDRYVRPAPVPQNPHESPLTLEKARSILLLNALVRIADTGDTADEDAIGQLLTSPQPDVRDHAAYGLYTLRMRFRERRKPNATSPNDSFHTVNFQRLVNLLRDSNNEVRRKAFYALGEVPGQVARDESAWQTLAALAGDSQPWIREAALGILGPSGDKRALRLLRTALVDSSPQVRSTAGDGLWAFGGPQATSDLMTLLGDTALVPSVIGAETRVQDAAIRRLWDLKDSALGYARVAMRSKNPLVRGGAVGSLAPGRTPWAWGMLVSATHDPADVVRADAAMTLGGSRTSRAGALLIGMLSDKSAIVRKLAGNVLSNQDSLDVPAVTRLLHDPGGRIRFEAARVLALNRKAHLDSLFLAALKTGDTAVVAGASNFLIARAVPGSESLLIAGLEQFGDQDMANEYYGCVHAPLVQAAQAWAERRGGRVWQLTGGARKWGSWQPAETDRPVR